MRILITGNMGYVGPALVRHLRNTVKDAELIGYDAGFFGHSLNAGGQVHVPLFQRRLRRPWWTAKEAMEPSRRHREALAIVEVFHRQMKTAVRFQVDHVL